jgi:SdiA-regulated
MQFPSSDLLAASRRIFIRVIIYSCLCMVLPALCGCQPVSYQSPPGYQIDKPQRFFLGDALHEISGIVFYRKNPDSVYAIEDENGKLFSFHPGDRSYSHVKFGKKGDYEDVAIMNDEFVVLRSDGSLFVFPVSQARQGKVDNVKEYLNILPEGEYEGLTATDDNRLIAMCKNCPVDKHKEVTLYILQKNGAGQLAITGQFKISVAKDGLESDKKKVRFHPSCLSQHPITKDWYIISSVNKALILFDAQWKFKSLYELNPSFFKQPEGLAFDTKGNMYVSNEGSEGSPTLLIFPYTKP